MHHHLSTRVSPYSLALWLASSLPAQLVFDDMAPATGTTNPSYGRGSAMVDLDGDGLPDLIAGNAGMENAFFRQRPDNTFEQVNAAWGIAPDSRSTWGVLVADFDNDGDSDVYFINGGFWGENQPNQYLRNDLATNGVFTDLPAGAASAPATNFGGTVLDYDRDGDLDIFVTTTWDDAHCTLLDNDGTGVFTDVSVAAGITHLGHFRHCTTGDIDNDGWPDVAVGGWDRNRVYRNDGDGTFTEVAAQVGLAFPLNQNFGLVLEDFDNDGWVDAYVPRYQLFGVTGPSQLLVNDGTGIFVDVTAGSGMPGQEDMGHNTGDLDADGFPDIYVGTGGPEEPEPDVLFRITPDGAGGLLARDVSASSGILSNGPTRCHGMPIGDYDGDGFVDVYVNNGGPDWYPWTLQENFLWKNRGNANGWTALRLAGVISNRSAVGARAMAVADSGKRVFRTLRAGHGFANTDSPILHFGTGTARVVDRIEIDWPSGIRQTLSSPAMMQVTDVVETGIRLVGEPVVGSRVALELAGPARFVHEVFVSSSAGAAVPLPQLGGILRLGAPISWLASVPLGPDGRGALPIAIPAEPTLVGAEAHFQAWAHPAAGSSGSVLSNPVTLRVL